MPKFSIIVPVYNVEKYVSKCLDSIKQQTFKDYEVIVVNDGTKDNSIEIAKKYDVKIITQKNQGLSEARNTGVKNSSGEYLIFLDSDDYLEKDLLKNINGLLKNNPDVIRYQAKMVWEDSDLEIEHSGESFFGFDGKNAFEEIVKCHFVEPIWCYAINRNFYIKNNFSFKKGTVHEDFGLTPLIIMRAKVVNCSSYVGYCYLQRNGSIMNSISYEKTQKKVNDMYNHCLSLLKELKKMNVDTTTARSYISNVTIEKITELKWKDYRTYLKLAKKNKLFDNLLNNTPKRKLKNILLRISPKLYYLKKQVSICQR